MSQGYVPFLVALLASAALSAAMFAHGWRYRRTASGRAFIALMACAIFYAAGYALELTSDSLARILLWNKVQYLGISFAPVLWILLAAHYAGRDAWLTRPVVAVLLGLSSLTLLFNVTNAVHHFFYRNVALNDQGPFPVVILDKGPWYWVHITYYCASFLAGNILLLLAVRSAAPRYKSQAAVMFVGSFIPLAGMVVYLTGMSPYGLDATPLTLTLAGPILAFGLLRFRLFDIVPIAKETVFSAMRDGVLVLDEKDRIVDLNPGARRLLPGLGPGAVGRAASDVLRAYPHLLDLIRPGGPEGAEFSAEFGSEKRFFSARLSTVASARRAPVGKILLISDATQQGILLEKLQDLAATDELTGAFNRRSFIETGRREIARAKRYRHPVSVLILDLDFFKHINDTLGHEAGDRVLRTTCAALKTALRSMDLLCRHGGEEFAILLPETAPDQGFGVAERLRATIVRNPVKISDETSVAVTASFGIAGLTRVENETLEDLIRAADRAMYKAKEQGRNCVVRANV